MPTTKQPRLTIGPSAPYVEYNPMRDPRMRDAIKRAQRDQPAMVPLTGKPSLPPLVK